MRAGSIVEIGPNRGLRYQVVHIYDGRAWLTPTWNSVPIEDCIVLLDRLREVGSTYPSFPR